MNNPMMKWGRKNVPAKREERGDPFFALQREINRVFDSFSRGFFSLSPFGMESAEREESWGDFVPQVDVAENDKEVRVTAELPGMDEKSVSVSLSGDALTIQGEKTAEHEEKEKGYHRIERSYGSFHRRISLPAEIDSAKAQATFKNGVLTVTVPKSADQRKDVKRIPIKGGSS